MDDIDIAQKLFKRETVKQQTTTATAMARSDSAGGTVDVYLDGEEMTVPTTCAVVAGDSVQVTIVSNSPTVTGVVGGGDKQKSDIAAAQTTADTAQSTADTAKSNAAAAQAAADANETALNAFKADAANTYETQVNASKSISDLTASVASTYATKTTVQSVSDAASAAQSTADTASSKADTAQNSSNTNANDLANYITSNGAKINDLQSQIDGSIQTWFYEVAPSDTTEPTSEWTTTALKNNHLGDLYYDTVSGYCYRWQVANNTYSWQRITDVDVTKALADAAAAQDTADHKRRVFVATPTTPYDVGDLWVSTDLMRCQIAKTSAQSYDAADWTVAALNASVTENYATKSELSATDSELQASVTDSYTNSKSYTDGKITTEQTDRNAAITAKADEISTTVNNTYAKTVSKGEQLITNGTGMMGDNTNFSSWTFVGADLPEGIPGSFHNSTSYALTDEYFPVDMSKKYAITTDARMDDGGAGEFYYFLGCFDIDKKTIESTHHMYIDGTLTTLSQDLKNGDTVAHFTDLSGWKANYNSGYSRSFIFWDYTNSYGYTYPELTYSRHRTSNSVFSDSSALDKTANTITLATAWTGGTVAAGTKVSQSNAGMVYKYLASTTSIPSGSWQSMTGYMSGTDYSGKNVGGMFPPGTAYVKYGNLWLNATLGYRIANVTCKEDMLSTTDAESTYATQTSLTQQADRITAEVATRTTTDGNVTALGTRVTQNESDISTLISAAVTSVTVEYALSDSTTTAPTSGWSATAPTWTSGKYMWQRTSTTVNDTTTVGTPTCIAGAQGQQGDPGADGATGATGTGVSSLTPQWYLSTSSTTATGGSWGTAVPDYIAERFYWTRTLVTYTDATTAYTTAVYDAATTDAVAKATALSTLILDTSAGTLVTKVGQSIGSLVNADGSFDIVALTWSGSTPTIGTTLFRAKPDEIDLGNLSESTIVKMCGGVGSIRQNNQITIAGDNGAVLQSTDGVENGSDFGIGISRSSAGVETAMVSGDDVVISGFVDRYTSAESTYANEITWRVLPFEGLKVAFGTGTWKSFTLSGNFNQTWFQQVVIPVPSGVFMNAPLSGVGSSGGMYALSISAYASWTATSVRFDMSKNYQGNPDAETFGIVLWGV